MNPSCFTTSFPRKGTPKRTRFSFGSLAALAVLLSTDLFMKSVRYSLSLSLLSMKASCLIRSTSSIWVHVVFVVAFSSIFLFSTCHLDSSLTQPLAHEAKILLKNCPPETSILILLKLLYRKLSCNKHQLICFFFAFKVQYLVNGKCFLLCAYSTNCLDKE